MKKAILSIIFLSLCTVTFAQKKVSFGLRVAANISNVSDTDLDPKTGPYIGALANIRLSKFYALQPELGYSNQGGASADRNFDDLDIHYITLAVTNNFYIQNSGFHFIVSPAIDFEVDNSFLNIANNNNEDEDEINAVDLSVGFGVGYQFGNGLSIDCRYKHGAVPVLDSLFGVFDDSHRNKLFQLGLTYKFKY